MRIHPTPVHCIACKHEWHAEMLTDAPIKTVTAAMKTLRCPTCGAGTKQIAFGRGDVPEPKPVLSDEMTNAEMYAAWIKMHDDGLSSQCIAAVMCGLPPTGDYPHDGADFGRCERLLILYPQWRARFGEMAAVNAYWAALVPRWGEIAEAWRYDEAVYREKGRKGKGWRCYDLMRSVLGAVGRVGA